MKKGIDIYEYFEKMGIYSYDILDAKKRERDLINKYPEYIDEIKPYLMYSLEELKALPHDDKKVRNIFSEPIGFENKTLSEKLVRENKIERV